VAFASGFARSAPCRQPDHSFSWSGSHWSDAARSGLGRVTAAIPLPWPGIASLNRRENRGKRSEFMVAKVMGLLTGPPAGKIAVFAAVDHSRLVIRVVNGMRAMAAATVTKNTFYRYLIT